MTRFAGVPLSSSPLADGKHLVGFYALLAAAKGPNPKGNPRSGALIYKHRTDGGASFPAIEDGHIPGQDKKTKLIAPENVPEAIKTTLKASEALHLFNDPAHSESLVELMVRAGLTEEDARKQIDAASEPLRSHHAEKVAMRQELALMLHADAVEMRCERVHGKWIFSRYDALALTLDEGLEGQARMIWERMLEEYPELNNSEVVTSSDNFRTFRFQGQGERETPVADIKGIVEMLLLVPGQRAAKFRKNVVDVFVRFVGGDETLVEQIRGFAHVQRFLQANNPNHPATAFGEEACAASPPQPPTSVCVTTVKVTPEMDPKEAARILKLQALVKAAHLREATKLAAHEKAMAIKNEEHEKTMAMKVAERKKLEAVHADELREIRENHEKLAAARNAKHEALMAKLKAENDAAEALRVAARQKRVEAEEAEQAAKRRCLSQRAIEATANERAIRAAAAAGTISAEDVPRLLGETAKQPIRSLERWLTSTGRCKRPSGCSSQLGRDFKAAVLAGEIAKTPEVRASVLAGTYVMTVEDDGEDLLRLHRAIEDQRNGILPGQQRMSFRPCTQSRSSSD